MFRWLSESVLAVLEGIWRYRAIIAIIVATVVGGVVLSIAEVDAKQSLATVLTGLTLVVSTAVLAAAITAAIYAKPAYDEASSWLKPQKLDVASFSLKESAGAVLTETDPGGDHPVFVSNSPLPCEVRLSVEIGNAGRGTTRCGMNLFVPLACQITPEGPAQHKLTAREEPARLAESVTAPARVSVANVEIPVAASINYAARIQIPDSTSHWDDGWPMRLTFYRLGHEGTTLEREWWITFRKSSGETDDETVKQDAVGDS